MADPVDISNMLDEEIAALATRCLDALSLADRIQAILSALHSDDDREELRAWIDEPESSEDDEDADLGDEPESES